MNNKLNTNVRQRSLSSDSEALVVNVNGSDIWLIEQPVGPLSTAAEDAITFAFCVVISLPLKKVHHTKQHTKTILGHQNFEVTSVTC
jgi:hypothetical protein